MGADEQPWANWTRDGAEARATVECRGRVSDDQVRLVERPIYHKTDETIRGHIFCSFLALLPCKKYEDRLDDRRWHLERANIALDLKNLMEVEVTVEGRGYIDYFKTALSKPFRWTFQGKPLVAQVFTTLRQVVPARFNCGKQG